jgi:uncharacterized membrane-anchored protein
VNLNLVITVSIVTVAADVYLASRVHGWLRGALLFCGLIAVIACYCSVVSLVSYATGLLLASMLASVALASYVEFVKLRAEDE